VKAELVLLLHTAHAWQSLGASHGNTVEGVYVSAGQMLHAGASRASAIVTASWSGTPNRAEPRPVQVNTSAPWA
jgi:hypothetical protein